MVAQEKGPLTVFRNLGCLVEDIEDGESILHMDGHKQTRHDREMKGHLAFVPFAEVCHRVFRPLVGLSQKHPVFVFFIDVVPKLFQEGMGLRQVFTVGSFSFVKVGNGIESHTIHTHAHPEIHPTEDLLFNLGVIEI